MPLPVGDRAVDEEVPEEDEDDHGQKAHALGRRPDDDGRGDNGERALSGKKIFTERMPAVRELRVFREGSQ